jgi:TolA-binding protein
MKMRFLLAPLCAATVLGLPPAAEGQEILKPFKLEERPTMRPEPVRPLRTLPAEPVERAVPVATPIPIATPIPRGAPTTRRGKPAATPRPAATPAPATTMPAPEPADPSEIRITPQNGIRNPEQAQIEVADNYYNRKMYDVAAPEYQRYLDSFPGGEYVPAAMFRLAESHRKNGSVNSAKATYENLLARFQAGDFVGPASYRLADLYYQERNYTMALPLYRKASARLKEPQVVNAAKFYQARCMEASNSLGYKLEALDLYRDLAEPKADNPFADASRLSMALLQREANRTSDALKSIQLLARQTQSPQLKAQAAVRAGLWLLDLKQPAKAEEELKRALTLPEIGPWEEDARMGLLRVYYESGRYKEVVRGYEEHGKELSKEVQPELLLLVANSQKRSERPAEALALYEQLVRDYPDTPYAQEASYEHLVTLYNTNADQLAAAIDAYLANASDPVRRDKVMLMKAESLLKQQDFSGAAALYEPVSASTHLTGPLKAEALYKLGWCAMQTRDFEKAIAAYTRLIDQYPTSKSLCSARVQRAIANQTLKNLAAAEKDYLEVIKKYNDCPERELALQQEALIRGQQNDNPGMAEHFTRLLKEYPKTTAAAQAHFWIGRTAFENKDYKQAVSHLRDARDLDRKEYFERATLPLMLGYYYLEDRDSVAGEVEIYRKEGKGKVPIEVLRWLGDAYLEKKSLPEAEKFLQLIIEREEVAARDQLKLGQVRLQLAKFAEAVPPFEKYLAMVQEPVSRALGLLELARAQIGMQDFATATKSVEETLKLQPEGKMSGEALIIAGDIEAAQEDWDAAARRYASVGAILDDEEVTPRALDKAYNAYLKAGKEAEAKKILNTLQSRYPEYFQRKKAAPKEAR